MTVATFVIYSDSYCFQIISKIVKKLPDDKIRRTKTYVIAIQKLETKFQLQGRPLREIADKMLELVSYCSVLSSNSK